MNSISGESHWEMDRKSKGKAVLTESDTGFNYSPAGLSILVVDHDQKSLQEVVTNLRKCKHQYEGLFWSSFWLSFLFDGVIIDTSHICERCLSLKKFKRVFWWLSHLTLVTTALSSPSAWVKSHLSLSQHCLSEREKDIPRCWWRPFVDGLCRSPRMNMGHPLFLCIMLGLREMEWERWWMS